MIRKDHLTNSGLHRDVVHQTRIIMPIFIIMTVATVTGIRFRKTLPRSPQPAGSPQAPVDMDEALNEMAGYKYYILRRQGTSLGGMLRHDHLELNYY